jgi:hypothetical protein
VHQQFYASSTAPLFCSKARPAAIAAPLSDSKPRYYCRVDAYGMTKLALAAKVSAFVFFSAIAGTFRGMRKVDGVLTLNLRHTPNNKGIVTPAHQTNSGRAERYTTADSRSRHH